MTKRSAVLLASAIRILKGHSNSEGTIMPKALADVKGKALKEATKKAAAKGITPPKHVPLASSDPEGHQQAIVDHEADQESSRGFPATMLGQLTGEGLDANQKRVVESKFVGNGAGVTTHRLENTMTDTTQAQDEARQKKIADQAARIAAKAEKQAAAEAKKAAALATKEAKAAEATAKKAEREAAKAAAAEAGEKAPRERTYTGSMLSLADKVATGTYVKGANGQLRSSDELAVTLEVVPAKKMVGLLLAILGFTENPYAHLNYGQQSMNLRNKLRGSIKSGTKVGEGEDAPVINIQRVQEFIAALPKDPEPATTDAPANVAEVATAE